MMNMSSFLQSHFEGIIALILGVGVPVILMIFKQWENNIKVEIRKEINGATARIDQEINRIKQDYLLLKENFKQLEKEDKNNLNLIEEKLDKIEGDILKLEDIKLELAGTREMLLIQNKALNQQLTDFKEFIKSFIK